jgi:hypothetical protein
MTAFRRLATGGTLMLAAAAVIGCDRTNSTTATPANTGTGATGGTGANMGRQVTGPTADQVGAPPAPPWLSAPTFGEATGTGFATGDAAHASGQGSGLMGYHGTGAMGTSFAISDDHKAPPVAKNAPPFVLPEQ